MPVKEIRVRFEDEESGDDPDLKRIVYLVILGDGRTRFQPDLVSKMLCEDKAAFGLHILNVVDAMVAQATAEDLLA